MTTTDFWGPVRELIESRSRFVLATHVNADGDGLGAQLSLYHFLRQAGKDVTILNTDPLVHNYDFLDPTGAVTVYDPSKHESTLRAAEVVILLDNSSANRLGRLREPIQDCPAVKVCIDHHPHPDTTWDVMAIDEKASATGQMIYRLLMEMSGDIPAEAATPIYVSIVTDTGNFRFSNTTPELLGIASDLVRRGVSVPQVYQQVYEMNSVGFVRLMGETLSQLKTEKDGKLGYLVITNEMVEKCGADDVDTGEIINNVLATKSARVAVLFKEIDGGQTKVSLRSKGSVNVNSVATQFGGGGHRNASGIVIGESLPGAMAKVLDAVRRIV